MRALPPLSLASSALLAILCGCGIEVQIAATSSSTTAGHGGAATTSSSGTAGGGGDTSTTTSSSTSSTTGTGGAACVGATMPLVATPLDLVFVVDASNSMSGAPWESVTTFLPEFFLSANATGIGAGLVLFPNYKLDECNATAYAIPDPPIASLPGNAPALTAALQCWGSGSPLGFVLEGALHAATAHKSTYPSHEVFLVLVSDGGAGALCGYPLDFYVYGDLAAGALGYAGVRTYALAMESSSAYSLSIITDAGGGVTYDASSGAAAGAAALQTLAAKGGACSFPIPQPTGQPFDPALALVQITPGGGAPLALAKVTDAAACGAAKAWHFDDDAEPGRVVLCPASCADLLADPASAPAMVFGCPTGP